MNQLKKDIRKVKCKDKGFCQVLTSEQERKSKPKHKRTQNIESRDESLGREFVSGINKRTRNKLKCKYRKKNINGLPTEYQRALRALPCVSD